MHRKLFFLIPLFSLVLQTACQKTMSEEQIRARAMIIHEAALIVDTHCDTPTRLLRGNYDLGQRHEPGAPGSGQIDFPRMKEGGLDAEFFAAFLSQRALTPDGYENAWSRCNQIIDSMEVTCQRYSHLAEIATTPQDAVRLEKEGKRAAFLGIENGYPLAEDISRVKHFADRGVRYITLCHTRNNQICDSSTDDAPMHDGLSDFGREVVKEMNRFGIMVDVSHISDKSFYDVLEITNAPVLASHSSVRAISDSPRNLDDDMLRALKANGGVIQICVLDSYIKSDPERRAVIDTATDSLRTERGSWSDQKTEAEQKIYREAYYGIRERFPSTAGVKDIADHIDYVVNLIGIEYVGVGTDFDGGGGIPGFNDVTDFPNLTVELFLRNYSEQDIKKIWGGNVMRVLQTVIDSAE
ncbi:dipeptidase [bacterium]|nr:dipeptidase [bacterium]